MGRLGRCHRTCCGRSTPLMSSTRCSQLFSRLGRLRRRANFVLSGSPARAIKCCPIDRLTGIARPVPLLSLRGAGLVSRLLSFVGKRRILFVLGLSNLAAGLVCRSNELVRTSAHKSNRIKRSVARGVPTFLGMPLAVPRGRHLIVANRSFVPAGSFRHLGSALHSKGKGPCGGKHGFTSKSMQDLSPGGYVKHYIHFLPFGMLRKVRSIPFPSDETYGLRNLARLNFNCYPFFSVSKAKLSGRCTRGFVRRLMSATTGLRLPVSNVIVVFSDLDCSGDYKGAKRRCGSNLTCGFRSSACRAFLHRVR